MKPGTYDDGAIVPRKEYVIERIASHSEKRDFWRLTAVISLTLISSAGIYGGYTDDSPLFILLWIMAASIIAGISGRNIGESWYRWKKYGNSYSTFLVHRIKRMLPVHLIGISLVLAMESISGLVNGYGQQDWHRIIENILPIIPHESALDLNPAWILFGAFMAATCFVPASVGTIENKQKQNMPIGQIIITFVLFVIIFSGPEEHWQLYGILFCVFIACATISVHGAQSASKKEINRKAQRIAGKIGYPILAFHWPIISAMAEASTGRTQTIQILTWTGSMVILAVLTFLTTRYVSIPLERATALDGDMTNSEI